ncbi:MAG TPA: hypothetical protein VMS96_11240 [Terriglobales bacterium]|nr:hypothetical protein [Terriglobales bacterium]
MPFSFLQRGNLEEHLRQVSLATYKPELTLEGLVTGVDNVRHDVWLSQKFCDIARQHVVKLVAKYGNVEPLLVKEETISYRPPSVIRHSEQQEKAKPADPAEFKRLLSELHVASLNRAKTDANQNLDLLLRLAVVKFLRTELHTQYNEVLQVCRAKVKTFEGPRQPNPQKGVEVRERFWQFQVNKKPVLRRVGQELFTTIRDIEKEALGRMRRSLFGENHKGAYELFLNRLIFTEDGRDDYLNAEHYVMLGNYENDVDRFGTMLELACAFLKSLGVLKEGESEGTLDYQLNVPENAQELVAGGSPDENTARGKGQKAVLQEWQTALENAGVMGHVIASYEVVPLLAQYSPPINAQQLKNALISKDERKRVEALLESHGKLSPAALHTAVKRVDGMRSGERAKLAGRFLTDFMRYHRDIRRLETLNEAMELVNVLANDRMRELSSINSTLYEFLLPEEMKPVEDKVIDHVILKADVRDSTTLTRTLFERGLNPASYFSLNFYDPINKLLPQYGATKVFIEGDAVILAMFGREGEPQFCVAQICVLAKEMIEIVRAYNRKSQEQGLPVLELGIGISYQDAAPMYLMDGTNRIMISKALNESDRLSSSSRGARKYLEGNKTPFTVFSFQTVSDADTGGTPDEFLVRYNIGGIHINQAAFDKLKTEISLEPRELPLATLLGGKTARIYSGMVPVPSGGFHLIAVREGRVPHINASEFTLKEWTDRRYYEVCTSEEVYALLAQGKTAAVAST